MQLKEEEGPTKGSKEGEKRTRGDLWVKRTKAGGDLVRGKRKQRVDSQRCATLTPEVEQPEAGEDGVLSGLEQRVKLLMLLRHENTRAPKWPKLISHSRCVEHFHNCSCAPDATTSAAAMCKTIFIKRVNYSDSNCQP